MVGECFEVLDDGREMELVLSVGFKTFIATSRDPKTPRHPPQHRLKFERVDTVRLHHGPNNGVGQDPAERRFAMTPIHRWTP